MKGPLVGSAIIHPMNSRLLSLAAALLCFATAEVATAQAPAAGGAQANGWLAYRNDSVIQVLVQASVVQNNQERRGPLHQINPREAAADQVFGVGPKIISISDSKGRLLYRDTINFTGKDQFFSIRVDVSAKDKSLKATLVPVSDPRTVPGMTTGFNPGTGARPPVGLMPTNPLPSLPTTPTFVPSVPVAVPNTAKPVMPAPPK